VKRLALVAVVVAAVAAPASAVERAAVPAPVALRVPIPPPDAISLAVFSVTGKLRPGATLPAHTDFSTLLPIVNASRLPGTLAVYGAERVARSGQDVTLTIGIVALRSAAPRTTSSAATDFPPVSDKAKDNVALAFAAGFQGNFFALSRQEKAEDEFEFQFVMDPKARRAQMRFYEANDLIRTYIKQYGSSDLPPLELFDSIVALRDDGSWEDGHNFGWKVKGSPAGSANAAPVLNDLDAALKEVESGDASGAKAAANTQLVSSVERLESAVGFPAGSLVTESAAPSPTNPGGTTTTTTTTGSQNSIVIANNVIAVEGMPCMGGGTLKVEWVIRGAPAGSELVVAMTGPRVPARKVFTLGSSGAASANYEISGSGAWTTKVVSIDGQTPTGSGIDNQTSSTCG
jgi:hypothetical protein